MSLKTYDPKGVVVIFDGLPISGFAPDTFVSVESESPMFEDVAGADGEVVRSKRNDNRATVTITLLKSSVSNAIFNAARLRDEASGAGAGQLMVRELASNSEAFAREAWVSERPGMEYGADLGTIEWKLRVADLRQRNLGIPNSV